MSTFPCEALVGPDMEAHDKVIACSNYCWYFMNAGHRSSDSIGSVGSACEQMAATVRTRLQACGVEMSDYHVDIDPDCSDAIRDRDACYLECYTKASCADLFDESPQAQLPVACTNVFMICHDRKTYTRGSIVTEAAPRS